MIESPACTRRTRAATTRFRTSISEVARERRPVPAAAGTAIGPLVLLVLIAAVLAGTPIAQTPLTSVLVASGLDRPLFVTAPVDDHARLFIVEQGGQIRVVRQGNLLPTPYLDLGTRTAASGERGLLGFAFHRDYAQNGFSYASYTRASDGASVIERFSVSVDPDVAVLGSGTVMFGPVAEPFANHNGGCIRFGPDGYLYFGLGDGGGGGDPDCRAQDRTDVLGKLLRLDIDNPASRVPPTNPYVGHATWRPEIWASGLRNPWRFSFDRLTGDLYLGDVGQELWEEIDVQPGTSAGGENYGWKVMEGATCYTMAACAPGTPLCNAPPLVMPVFTYGHAAGCSVTGGHVYRGAAIPDLRGTYFFGDYCTGSIWSFVLANGTATDIRDRTQELQAAIGPIGRLASFGEDAIGEIHFCANGDSVYRISRDGPATTIDLGGAVVGSNGLTPHFAIGGNLGIGGVAELHVRAALPGTLIVLLLGESNQPTPIGSYGTFLPHPVSLIGLTELTDGNGSFVGPCVSGIGPWTVYGQWAVLDPGRPNMVAITNALQIDFP